MVVFQNRVVAMDSEAVVVEITKEYRETSNELKQKFLTVESKLIVDFQSKLHSLKSKEIVSNLLTRNIILMILDSWKAFEFCPLFSMKIFN
jgi:hypothetical protein